MQIKLPSLLSMLLLLVVLSLCAQAEDNTEKGLRTAPPEDVGLDPSKMSDLESRLQKFVDDKQIPGIVSLVAKDGCIVHHHAIGHADITKGRPMTKDSIFAIASMTKPITATAVMILVDDGKINLDAPVAKYLPEFKEQKLKSGETARPITLRDVMTHTAGLGGSQRSEATLQAAIEQIAQRPLDFEPGTRWQYSPGLTVAGRVVEVVSGHPFDKFLDDRIFTPLGMNDTTFELSEEQQQRLVQLVRLNKEGSEQPFAPAENFILAAGEKNMPNPSGGLFSTAGDMVKFYQMVLSGGELNGHRIVSQASVDEMTRLQTNNLQTGFTDGNGWGLGWCLVQEPQGVTRMLSPGTYGHGGAFGTQGWVDPKKKMIFVLLVQRSDIPNSDASQFRDALQQLAVAAMRSSTAD